MDMTPVKSSNIAAVGYDEKAKELHVKFTSGDTYCYSDVEKEKHDALMSAKSHGVHFHNHIRSAHKFRKV